MANAGKVRHTTRRQQPLRIFCLRFLILLVVISSQSIYAATQVSQFGITWKFDKNYTVGQFCNGDYYVIGSPNVTIIAIEPNSRNVDGRIKNGSMLNPLPSESKQGFDNTLSSATYSDSLNVAKDVYEGGSNLTISPPASLVSTISVDEAGHQPQINVCAILTVLSSVPAANSFRPPYAGTDKTIGINYTESDLDYSVLQTKPVPASALSLSTVAGYFARPWLDYYQNWMGRRFHPQSNMPNYGREIARDIGTGGLSLQLNYTNAEKKTLLIRFVQLGIDFYGITQAVGGSSVWINNGGHMTGRKLPIMLAGKVLHDSDMLSVGQKSGDYLWDCSYGPGNPPPDYIHFGDDDQTFYVAQFDVDLTLSPDSRDSQVIQYTSDDIGLPEWGIVHSTKPSKSNAFWGTYYRNVVGCALPALALTGQLMNLGPDWNHEAFFDYTGRWVNVDDSGTQTVGTNQTFFTQFHKDMWNSYWVAGGGGGGSTGNQPPVLQAIGNKSVVEETLLTFTVTATDADGDTITYSAQGLPSGATFSNQTFSWTPTYVQVGNHSVTFNVSDGVDSGSESIIITVNFTDTDSDGLPDTWEMQYFNDLAQGPSDNPDGDTYTNLQEYQNSTDPTVFDQLPPDLILHMKFDDDPSDGILDSSTYGDHGVSSGESYPIVVQGKVDNAYKFDGVDDYVEIGIGNLNANKGTITLWAYPEGFSSSPKYVFSHATQPWSNRIQLYTDDAEGYLDLGFGDSHTKHTNIENLEIQRWYHIALSWDGTSYVVYVDGTAKASGAYTGLSSLETYADIGNDGYSTERTEAFNGIIDEVRVYNRALTSDEITALYNEVVGNNAPALSTIGNQSINENEALTFIVSAADADGDAITYSAQNLPSGATFSGQSFSWTPSFNQAGSYQVTFIASDGQAQDSETITITVNNVNRLPVLAAIGDKSVDENSTLSFSVSASDADGDNITYSVQTLPSGATFASPFTWTPSYSQAGAYQVTFTASDGLAQDSETITITVNNVNRAPVLSTISDKSVYLGDSLNFAVDATDPDSDSLTYSAQNIPSGATFTNRTFSWTPSESQVASYNVTFVASDGQLQDSEQITITVNAADTLPPSVTNISPASGSIQVPLNSLATLHITDAGKGVDANSVTIKVNNNTVYTSNTAHYSSAYGDCRRSGTSADYAFTYQSSELFRFNRRIRVTVNATDLAGNVMNEYSYSFRTEMRSFGKNKPVSSSADTFDKGRPVTARDSSGNIWAAWQAGPAGNRDIYVSKLTTDAENFSSSVQLTNSIADQYNTAIAISSDDKLYIVWQDNRRGNWDIYLSTSSDGASWSTATRVVDSNDNEVNPAIAIDNQSPYRAYITWQDDRGGNYDIYVASSNNNFATNTTSRITLDSSNQIQPDIAIDSGNTVYIVWTDERNSSSDIYAAASNSGPWTNVPIATSASNQSSPAIATEDAGPTLHLLWVDDTPGNKDIYYATSNGLPASPLTGSSIIDDGSGTDQLDPTIDVTGSTGNSLSVFAGWQDWRNVAGSNADTDLYFAEISSDSWTNVLVGDEGTNANQSEPAMGVDAYGHPYLVWTDSRNSTAEIYYAGSTFTAPTAVASKEIPTATGAIVGTNPNAIDGVEDVSVTVPANAYPSNLTITISEIRNSQAFAVECLAAYDFGPSGTEFSQPVTVTIPYIFSGSGSSATPYWFNALSGALSQQGITDIQDILISPTLHALQFKTTHFTPFYLLLGSAAAAATGGGGGGGGCSLSVVSEGSIVEFLLPYIGLAVVMVVLKLRDIRNRRVYHYDK